jgi:hypothetical protein
MDFNIQDWCDQFKALPQEPMSNELCTLFLAVMMGNVDREVLEEMFIYKVVVARAEAIGLEMEDSLRDFLACLCKSPGTVTMYLSLLRQEQENGKQITMSYWSELFPTGYPTEDNLQTLWDAQKVADAPLGNALDLNWWDAA